jgi:hypothetical protein
MSAIPPRLFLWLVVIAALVLVERGASAPNKLPEVQELPANA